MPEKARYGQAQYWDDRYTKEPTTFEWYQGYQGLKPVLVKYVSKDARLLQVGVGTSRLQEDMVKDGFRSIVSIDYSKVAIEHMREVHKGYPELKYQVADSRDMTCFPDGSFDAILDKGTLDAVLCGDNAATDSPLMLNECTRVLGQRGIYILITYGDPQSRLYYLDNPDYQWEVAIYYCIKRESKDNPNCNRNTDRHVCGPFAPGDKELDETLGSVDVHFIYVCKKVGKGSENQLEGLRTNVS